MTGPSTRTDATVDVLVVCTDRGRHKPVKVARFECRDRGDSWSAKLVAAVDPGRDDHLEERVRYDLDSPRHVVELRCVRCGRTARHPLHSWANVAVELATRGTTRFDLADV